MGPSKPGKTAPGLQRDPGNVACNSYGMDGKTGWMEKSEERSIGHLNKSVNLIFCAQSLFSLKHVEDDDGVR